MEEAAVFETASKQIKAIIVILYAYLILNQQ